MVTSCIIRSNNSFCATLASHSVAESSTFVSNVTDILFRLEVLLGDALSLEPHRCLVGEACQASHQLFLAWRGNLLEDDGIVRSNHRKERPFLRVQFFPHLT